MVHDRYQNSGGEDQVFEMEVELLRKQGHAVMTYEDDNSRIKRMPSVVVALDTLWAENSRRRILDRIRSEKPDLVHFHNTFPLISPSAYYACRTMNLPVVQTLHNYRLLCPAATFYRGSAECEKCLGRVFAWPGVRYSCYRDSKLQTAGLAAMVSLHKALGTWKDLVTVYIALTDFMREKFIAGGFHSSRIHVKPNFVAPDPGFGAANGNYALFAGRLSKEKGVLTMLDAWRLLPPGIPLKIAGDGPLRNEVLRLIQNAPLNGVEYLGAVPHPRVISLMKDARFLVIPSEWYEGFPMVIAEAFACGLPVISSALGSMLEIIEDKVTGIFFNHGDAEDLAKKVVWMEAHPSEMAQMRLRARKSYLERYSEESGYRNISRVYNSALGRIGI